MATWLIPFALVVYLGVQGGGFETITYSEVGILAWWVVLLGGLAAALPGRELDRASWIGLGALTAFALWTTIGISWSESAERSLIEVGRVASYLGIFVLLLRLQAPGSTRRMLSGAASGVAVIVLLALAYRLLPDLFPPNDLAEFLPETRSRLAYPLNYWNGLASLTAIGLPLMIWLATTSERIGWRSIAAAAATLMPLTIFFTISRGGTIAAAVGVVALLALHPERLRMLLTLVPIAIGSTSLVLLAGQFEELKNGLENSVATEQGLQVLVIAVVICAAVGGLVALSESAYRDGIFELPLIDRDRAGKLALAGAGITVLGFLLAGGPGWLSDQFESFKGSNDPGVYTDRFASISGNGRWQYWSAALDANATAPLIGIGPGTFDLFWAQFGTLPGFIRNAHSFFVEVLGELGIIGLLLIAGFVVTILVAGVRKAFASAGPEREMLAAATAAALTFTVAAGVDWSWELAVVPVLYIVVAATILGYRVSDGVPGSEAETAQIALPSRRRGIAIKAGVALACLAGIAAIAIPARGVELVDESQELVRAGDLDAALEKAETAIDWQPYAAKPRLQKSGILELQGKLVPAALAARLAVERDRTDWRPYYTLARVEALRERIGPAVKAYKTARELNPRSLLFQR